MVSTFIARVPSTASICKLWLIDDSRWDTLEAEIRKGEPLQLGREATSSLVRFEESRTDFKYDELATFLFTTREGGRGIVQVFPKDRDADRYRLRYRMWLTAPQSQAEPAAARRPLGPRGAKSPGTPFGKIVTTTLEPPAEGREFLLDLKPGGRRFHRRFLKPDEIAASQRTRRRSGRDQIPGSRDGGTIRRLFFGPRGPTLPATRMARCCYWKLFRVKDGAPRPPTACRAG